jgi:alpha-tubulin suppressor-like RCC1 family protein
MVTVSNGSAHSCGVDTRGAAWCWGSNMSGQLGDGTNNRSNVPVPVVGLSSGVGAISAGASHSCAVVSGAVKCWGSNM